MEADQTSLLTHPYSPLQLVAFNSMEDELFGVPGTPERIEYEARVAERFEDSTPKKSR